MARRKMATRLIENARSRAATYAKRTKGLQKKAWELSELCGVPVALVCAPAPGAAGTRLVWESEAGVLDRYRGAALTPEARARHTHRGYLEAELGKERAKLARARPAALPDWDAALDGMTLDEARAVLRTIDAALRAAGDRMAALGLTADGRVDEQLALALAPGDDDATGVPQQLGPENMEHAGFQMQMVPWRGGNDDDGLIEHLLWDDHFPMQPGHGLEYVGGDYDVGAIDETHAPAGYGDNAESSWPDLTMCYADDGSRDAVLPAGYYYPDPEFVDGTLPPEQYSSQVVTGGDYIGTLPLEYPMGMDENFTDLDNSYKMQWQTDEFQHSDTNSSIDENYSYLDNGYAAHWQAEEFQRSDTGTGHYQHQCSDPGECSSSQVFNYAY